ncbi:EAL domain-containing protein [Candidatus Accumulibacter vicinus]|uniref:Cyclic di-GMP phosphodiesterase Gmr n=1 Tax=Candidatus Accumulibacter vicinus TaxID=2954382 RepID=A0A084XWD1_9PROT|nr:EAL domain-containing protein [Candidatus Accumulibacter vicinus]KFB66775.1 MAG: Cyclic di-GMP phosphodiesterase Gmr [Candidatus Accumulibacter vicinus]
MIALLQRSLKTRVTLFTLSIFVISLWALAFYTSQVLREDMERLLGEQQYSIVSVLAAAINQELGDRLSALEKVVERLTPAMLGDAATMQRFLEDRPVLQTLFNGGVITYRTDGTAIADSLPAAGRIGVNYLDIDAVATALQKGRSTISRPVMGKKLRAPVFGITVPIRGHQGKVIGAMAGVVNLGMPGFLDKITESTYGKTGGYLMVAREYRLVITATDKSRIMETLPPPGVNWLVDRFIQGYEGSGVVVNPQGVEVLSSAKGIPAAGWYLAAFLPTAEAFAPILDMQKRMLLSTFLLTLLAGSLTWWMLRRQLAPMLATARTLAAQSAAALPLKALPITRQDEVGDLIGGFNRQLLTLGQREDALKESEERFRNLYEKAPLAYQSLDAAGNILQVNNAWLKLFGFTHDEVIGRFIGDFLDERSLKTLGREFSQFLSRGRVDGPVFDIRRKDGSSRLVEVNGRIGYDSEGNFCQTHCILTDITDRTRAEAALLESEERWKFALEGAGEGVWDWNIQTGDAVYSRRWKEMLGFAEGEIGNNSSEWSSRVHPEDMPKVMAAIQAHIDGKTPSAAIEFRMMCKDGSWLWTLGRGMVVSRDASGKPLRLVGTNADISERKASADKIERLAFYDPLTDLPNRRLLRDRLEQALASSTRRNRHGALMLLDMDDFKTLNDTLGHDVGDQFLVEVARRLQASVREGDTVARHGGDEFVVILEDLSEDALAATQAESVAEKILHVVSQPYLLDLTLREGLKNTCSYHCTSSIGITLFRGHSLSADELMKHADTAMYQAKAGGRNSLRFFDPEMQAIVAARATLDSDLREAVREGQFCLYYQPQVDSAGNRTGAEALVRWQHPRRGLVSPGEFIPQAEATGLIIPIGHWVLETACAQLVSWETVPEISHLTVAVNVSARQFRHVDFVGQVLAIIDSTGVNPQKLKLELTESLLLDDVEDIISKMTVLKAKGIGFSLDDFGTGYSSLSYLKRLPLDQLKIDQSFVRDVLTDPNDAAIARTIVALAQSMGLAVIAEGVETEAQREFLAANGCSAYQGYLYGRPMPLGEFSQQTGATAREV